MTTERAERDQLLQILDALAKGEEPTEAGSLILLGREGTSNDDYVDYIGRAINEGCGLFYLVAVTDEDFKRAQLVSQRARDKYKLEETARFAVDKNRRETLLQRSQPTIAGIVCIRKP